MATTGPDIPTVTTREELRTLVAEAQLLVELAQQEAARIVTEAREETARRATELVTQAEQLRRLLPDARIVVGHGQMPEGVLEKVMLQFADGAADVLVCTTIIEPKRIGVVHVVFRSTVLTFR